MPVSCEKFHDLFTMGHLKLHIPGPVEVSDATFQAMCTPMIGHRGQEFKDLYAKIQPQLQQLFYTERKVFLSTSSAWGVMEASIRNLVPKKVLCCANGAFSGKWHDVALRCGKEADRLDFDWGSPVCPDALDEALSTGGYDAVTLVHNETSTGTMSDLQALASLKKKHPKVMFVVDCVSSLSALAIEFDTLGIDVLLAGTQKALALPPGFSMFVCSEAALERASTLNDRGYYFDFLEFQKNAEKDMTPSTPSISHAFALSSKLDEMLDEGLENRYARHARLAQMTRDWASEKGFELFPDKGFESVTLTCLNNGAKPGGRTIDVAELQKQVRSRGIQIDGGYGKVKGKTFRLSSMGNETEQSMKQLYGVLDESLAAME
jgi:aspartate aminotransferase-like enzyme